MYDLGVTAWGGREEEIGHVKVIGKPLAWTYQEFYLPPQSSYFMESACRPSSYTASRVFMLSMYFKYVLLSDMVKEISDFSERGVCDRPAKKKRELILMKKKGRT